MTVDECPREAAGGPTSRPPALEELPVPFVLTVRNNVKSLVSKAEVTHRIERMMRELQLDQEEVSFLLTDDEQIHDLNKQWRGKDKPTDVLAFPLREGEFPELRGGLLGDVVISLETADRQAREHGHSLREEAVFLLAHGLLHLLGWDHDTKAKDAAMRRESERLCAAAGIPAPAAAGGVVNTKSKKSATKKRTSRRAPTKTPRKTGRR